MLVCFFLTISTIVLGAVDICYATNKKSGKSVDDKVETFNKIRKLYYKTADDSMRCWLRRTEKCAAETLQYKHELKDLVRETWLEKHYFRPEEEQCVDGFGHFTINVFDDPAKLPCDDHAFDPPKHSDKESDDTYYELKRLYDEYDEICFSHCKEKKWKRGQALAKAIQKAENDGLIPRDCQKNGLGWYSFTSGMPETEMPCRPSREPNESTGRALTATVHFKK